MAKEHTSSFVDTGLEGFEKLLGWAGGQFERAALEAEKALTFGKLPLAVLWSKIAADFAWHRHPGFYASASLESILLEVAQSLEKGRAIPSTGYARSLPDTPKARILHVMTQAYVIGGHTRVVERWIRNTADSYVQSLVATNQKEPLPEWLNSAIAATGGWYRSLALSSLDLLERASLLRQLGRSWADIIVLHTHPSDPLPIVAFGIEGGPPVLLLNHADHAFWLGVSIADIVVNLRQSSQKLSISRRGVRKSKILPIPLVEPASELNYLSAREKLGIDDNMVAILTIGSPHKFISFGGCNFIDTIFEILARNQRALLIAIGPKSQGQWAKASKLVNGRVKALGPQKDLTLFHACADIYLDPFPISSLTAMLEVGIRGLPVIGLNNSHAPILTGDDISIDGLNIYATSLEEYIALVENMIASSTLRKEKGVQIKNSIKADHLPPGWNNYLQDIILSLPSKHAVKQLDVPSSTMDSGDHFLAGFNKIEATHYRLNNSISLHMRNFPARQRVKLLLNGILGNDIGLFSLKDYIYLLTKRLKRLLRY